LPNVQKLVCTVHGCDDDEVGTDVEQGDDGDETDIDDGDEEDEVEAI
jgi:hypothetical protein